MRFHQHRKGNENAEDVLHPEVDYFLKQTEYTFTNSQTYQSFANIKEIK